MSSPVQVSERPFAEEVDSGKSYFICTCGLSKNQPYCDASHKGTDHKPVKYEAAETKRVFICGCGKSANHPLCDGSHKTK